MKKAWKSYADIQIEAPGIKKIIAWATSCIRIESMKKAWKPLMREQGSKT